MPISKEQIELQTKLSDPFPEDTINWRVQNSGWSNNKLWTLLVPYLDARQVQQRLDDVVGVDKWEVSYHQIDNGFIATIKMGFIHDGQLYWVSKADGAEETNIEATKGGISDSFKRAGVMFGIGRYLYNTGKHRGELADKSYKGKTIKSQLKGPDGKRSYYTIVVPPLNSTTVSSVHNKKETLEIF